MLFYLLSAAAAAAAAAVMLSECRVVASATCTPDAHPAVQMTDVLRRYPDAAEACVEAVAAIPEEVRAAGPTSAQTPVARLLRPAELHCTAYRHVHRILPPSAVSACNFLRSQSLNPPPGPPTCGCSASSALGFRSVLSAGPLGEVAAACFCCWVLLVLPAFTAQYMCRMHM